MTIKHTGKHPEIFLVPENMHQISCDGGGALGHPKVYYTFDGQDQVICGYCDRLYTKTPVTGAKPFKKKRLMEADDHLLQVYNRELMALAAEAGDASRIEKPEGAALAVSPICGSEVMVELSFKANKVAAFGYEIEACTLTKAVVAVMKKAILGKTREDIATAGAALKEMLERGAPAPAGDWAGLKILEPAREYRARHNSILLPFEAVEKIFEKRERP